MRRWGLPLAALTAAAIVLTNGNPAAAVAPVLAACACVLVLTLPLPVCAQGLLFLCLIADAPQDNPMSGNWHSPLYRLGELLCSNWSATFGISALPFSGMDLIACALLLRAAFSTKSAPLARPLRSAAFVFLATVAFLAVAGAALGGAGDASYWQVRQLAWIPGLVFVFSRAVDGEPALLRLSHVVLAAALIKCAVGLYFHFVIALPSPVILSHSETLLLCLSVVLVAARWIEAPRSGLLLLLPPLLATIWLNNRRLAWVDLTAAAALVWAWSPWNAGKRKLARAAIFAVPLAVAYIAAGWQSDDIVFKPVAAARTVISPRRTVTRAGADSSTHAREIENFNLSQTLRLHPLGTGLGHPYEEVIKGPDISRDFELYRYIPHNTVLWMLSAGGPLGFFGLWWLFVVGIYLAAQARRRARTPVERCAALAALCAQVLFLIQVWGDMGTQSWSAVCLASVGLAVSGALALRIWPERAAALSPA